MRHVLSACLFGIALSLGCGPFQDLPIPLYFDRTFTPFERGAIMNALDEWNKKTRPRLRHETDIFFYTSEAEPFTDPNIIDRNTRTIFNIDPKTICPPLHFCQELNGYGTLGFIFLFTPVIQNKVIERLENGDINFDPTVYFRRIRTITIHELGHLLGLMHFNNRPGIMNKKVPLNLERPTDLTEADLDAFCLLYECK